MNVTHPQWEPDGFIGKIEGHPCYDPVKDLIVPLMKTPNHFHLSPLIGGPTNDHTWLAFHRGRVSVCACAYMRCGGEGAGEGCARRRCVPATTTWPLPPHNTPPHAVTPPQPLLACLTVWAGANGEPSLLPRHPPAAGQRLPRRRLVREVQNRGGRVSRAAATITVPVPAAAGSCRAACWGVSATSGFIK